MPEPPSPRPTSPTKLASVHYLHALHALRESEGSEREGSPIPPHQAVDTGWLMEYNVHSYQPEVDGRDMETTAEAILERIDTISHELQELPVPDPGTLVAVSQARPPDENPAEQLFGALGHGSWDEYDQRIEMDYNRPEYDGRWGSG